MKTNDTTSLFEHDAPGETDQPISFIRPDSEQAQYAYNAIQLLATATDEGGGVFAYSSDEEGRDPALIEPNWARATLIYDKERSLTSHEG